jgi:hypothetical protein
VPFTLVNFLPLESVSDVEPSAETMNVWLVLRSDVYAASGARLPKFCVNSTLTTLMAIWHTAPVSMLNDTEASASSGMESSAAFTWVVVAEYKTVVLTHFFQ